MSKKIRIRAYEVLENGLEQELFGDDGKPVLDDETGTCTGFCLMAINETEEGKDPEACTTIRNMSVMELTAMLIEDPHTAKASMLASAFMAAKRQAKEYENAAE